jgi:hypothetical protein
MRVRRKYYRVGRTALSCVCPRKVRIDARGRRASTSRNRRQRLVITNRDNGVYCRAEKDVTKAPQIECPHLYLFGREILCLGRRSRFALVSLSQTMIKSRILLHILHCCFSFDEDTRIPIKVSTANVQQVIFLLLSQAHKPHLRRLQILVATASKLRLTPNHHFTQLANGTRDRATLTRYLSSAAPILSARILPLRLGLSDDRLNPGQPFRRASHLGVAIWIRQPVAMLHRARLLRRLCILSLCRPHPGNQDNLNNLDSIEEDN